MLQDYAAYSAVIPHIKDTRKAFRYSNTIQRMEFESVELVEVLKAVDAVKSKYITPHTRLSLTALILSFLLLERFEVKQTLHNGVQLYHDSLANTLIISEAFLCLPRQASTLLGAYVPELCIVAEYKYKMPYIVVLNGTGPTYLSLKPEYDPSQFTYTLDGYGPIKLNSNNVIDPFHFPYNEPSVNLRVHNKIIDLTKRTRKNIKEILQLEEKIASKTWESTTYYPHLEGEYGDNLIPIINPIYQRALRARKLLPNEVSIFDIMPLVQTQKWDINTPPTIRLAYSDTELLRVSPQSWAQKIYLYRKDGSIL